MTLGLLGRFGPRDRLAPSGKGSSNLNSMYPNELMLDLRAIPLPSSVACWPSSPCDEKNTCNALSMDSLHDSTLFMSAAEGRLYLYWESVAGSAVQNPS